MEDGQNGKMVTQHHRMAQGQKIEQEGATPASGTLHHGRHVEHMDAHDGTDSSTLAHHERSAPPPIAHHPQKHPATAHSDHGPHHMTTEPHFESLKQANSGGMGTASGKY